MLNNKNILLTGGAGFVGSHLVDMLLQENANVIVLDALTYAGNMQNLANARLLRNFTFIHGDICDQQLISDILYAHKIHIVFHLAAESHVDNSLSNPGIFINTNITGTYNMLVSCQKYWESNSKPATFKFIHVSTDEVFGQLAINDRPFSEVSSYKPNSPYSASKAGGDMLVRAWFHSYKFPAIITHSSNNFGPRQHGEKFIPTVIRTALLGENIPIYGNGKNIRDWIFVQDFCRGLILVSQHGLAGECYCFGAKQELTNYDLAIKICGILDRLESNDIPYARRITFVNDRKGHDFRYAIDPNKAIKELGWHCTKNLEENLNITVKYYLKLYAESFEFIN